MSALMVAHPKPHRNTYVSTKPAADFVEGMRLFAEGKTPEACRNPRQRAGYMATLAVDADADTAAWLASRDGWHEETEWIRTGM